MRRPAEYSSVSSDADIFGEERDSLLKGRSLGAGVMSDFGCGEHWPERAASSPLNALCLYPLPSPISRRPRFALFFLPL